MKTIFVIVWMALGQPIIITQEVDSFDTCKSLQVEVERMVKFVEKENGLTPGRDSSFKTFCHLKEIK